MTGLGFAVLDLLGIGLIVAGVRLRRHARTNRAMDLAVALISFGSAFSTSLLVTWWLA